MSKFWIFLSSVWQEAKKVKWPNKKEALTSTLIVVAILIFVSVYLFLIDYGFLNLFTKFIYPLIGIKTGMGTGSTQ
ncbi:preprotein translocase subunit SecE [Marinitoga sp. 1135]|uniref:Protein translocase subunit SecE n=1 Tax=Marinitoga piezophila (strain DSM 14283 / JCM 11233 / KA3) TaxID=443254 RepID=H2J5F5_MARPK|nr:MULTISPECIES: preprotein translocase subunit SecE [Marinitoga]AEX86099.1 preprotein translocase, SecE subunit [Marinitoga piezophila KA3]APT76517.1 preprotein translocase subunit SecE [Marinitoga sp. 1137]NUU96284.1 preprotein translocase subunit SecE [Marinitoga sp. 1135]NUU98203.1 preprotein translocase subunit SecE [Marinitoga sp. 1138]